MVMNGETLLFATVFLTELRRIESIYSYVVKMPIVKQNDDNQNNSTFVEYMGLTMFDGINMLRQNRLTSKRRHSNIV